MREIMLKVASFLALSVASSAVAQGPAPTPDKRPEVPKSIANAKPTHFTNGPLLKRARTAFAAANEEGESAFSPFLIENAQLELRTYPYPQPTLRQPLDVKVLRAIMASCDGPLSYDEGTYWVELNWVCRVDADAPLARFYAFRDSPEIVMLIEFQGDRIKRIDANEPLMIPGVKRLSMDAYAVAHSQK